MHNTMSMIEHDTTTNSIEPTSTATTAVMMTIMMNPNTNFNVMNDGLVANQMQSQYIQAQQQQLQTNQHYLVSNNSFELNTATSLSDDSGILHTNSSISSSGSSRLGLCKFEFELAESDGEASQFDSLDNCSDGGMSAENFNTLKKVPLAPIDPPPEFQDSPQTTLLRSQVLQNYALKLTKNIIENACTIYTKLPNSLKYNHNIIDEDSNNNNNNNNNNSDVNNIYDEPPPLFVNTINSNNSNSNTISSNTSIHSRVKLKKILYSPLHHGSNLSTINRPNSRNSLNSRLSSSHNSLSVNTTNKVDDSIFITQAMSHDALLGKEIIDFYNVPIDSDIYTLPIDFINKQSNNNNNNNESSFLFQPPNQQHTINTASSIFTNVIKNSKINRINKLKYNKNNLFTNNNNNSSITSNINKKRRKGCGISNGIVVSVNDKCTSKSSKLIKSNDKRHSVPENLIEPMHMTLDEVKRYYHSLYSSSSDSQENLNNNNNINNSSSNSSKFIQLNNTNRKSSSNHTVCNTITPTSFITTSSTSSTINTKLSSSYVNTNSSSNNNNHGHNILHGQSNKINKLNKASKNGLKKSKDVEYRQHNRQSTSVIPTNSTGTNTSFTTMGIVGINTTESIVTVSSDIDAQQQSNNNHNNHLTQKKSSQFSINLNLKQKFCSIFRFRNKNHNSNTTNISNHGHNINNDGPGIDYGMTRENDDDLAVNSKKIKFPTRALPPLPSKIPINSNINTNNNNNNNNVTIKNKNNKISDTVASQIHHVIERPIPNPTIIDFATNIEKVKECGWYWGPISGEAAEKILSNEPDGSFIVRDSSDDHYIFSITFKLSGCIRHVRIDQDQGEFSFGSRALFKSRTITEFIENAVEHSRSGRYLFFLHRRPEHGPMRVQLTNPVSRFRHIQSLQHMCRFVILKAVRKDLIRNLPLPRRLLDYLSYKNYYSEQIESDSPQSQLSGDGSTS